MKTTNVFLIISITIILIVDCESHSKIYHPVKECIRDSSGQLDQSMLSPYSNKTICRIGQEMRIVTIPSNDSVTEELCCCEWNETLSAVQIRKKRRFFAHSCIFENESTIPSRESLLLAGNDLVCYKDEEMRIFKAEVGGIIRDMACCGRVYKAVNFVKIETAAEQTDGTTTTIEPHFTQLEPTEQEQLDQQDSAENPSISSTLHPPNLHAKKLKTARLDLSQLALSSDEDLVETTTQQLLQLIEPDSIHELEDLLLDDEYDEGLLTSENTSAHPHMKLNPKVYASNSLPNIMVASECIYASETSTTPIIGYMSYEDPDHILACRSQQIMFNTTTTNPSDGKTYKIHCCKTDLSLPPIMSPPLILAMECEYDEDGGLQVYSGVKPGPDLVCDTSNYELLTVLTFDPLKSVNVDLACCTPKHMSTTKITTTTIKSTAATLPMSTANGQLNTAGAECVYLRDGTLKVNYMDYCEDNPICRSQQVMKQARRNGYDRCCCQEDKSLPPSISTIKLKAMNCAFKTDGSIHRWSIIRYGSDLVCDTGFKIQQLMFYENEAETNMACCVEDVPETTTVPSETTSTTAGSSQTTIAPASTLPIAGIQCSYNIDLTIKTGFMDDCKPNYMCRAKEVKLEVFVQTLDKKQIKKCCCDYRKELSANTSAVPTVIAPKCIYDQSGYVNTWSVVESGSDLGCVVSDNLMTYDLGGGDDGKMSCCLKKDATTIATTMRTTPMITTTTMMTTKTPSFRTTRSTSTMTRSTTPAGEKSFKRFALECVYLKNGSLNVEFMDWFSSRVACRSQFLMKKITVEGSDGLFYPKICCEFSADLPFDPSLPPLVAPVCYFSSKTADLYRWSITISGPDLICLSDYYMYNTTNFLDGVERMFSCCQPINKPIPTKKPVTTTTKIITTTTPKGVTDTDETTTLMPSITSTTSTAVETTTAAQPQYQLPAPVCTYRANKTIHIDYMKPCDSDPMCYSKHVLIMENATLANGDLVILCCCDPRPDLPPISLTVAMKASRCHFDVTGNIVPYSLIPFTPDIKCDAGDELKNFTVDVEATENVMSCCMLIGETTLATTAKIPEDLTTTPMSENTTKGDKFVTVPTDGESTTKIPTNELTTMAPTTRFKGKRTVPPRKAFPPRRVITAGDCPDCLYPDSGPIDSVAMIIQHLQLPGPVIGRCPFSTHTLRRIQPMPLLGYKEGRCCCENDAFPLPYRL